jgi:hypothetical protein
MKFSLKPLLADRSGTSIVIALVLIAAITFFTIGISSTAITALRTASYSKKALQSEYAAQSALEIVKNVMNNTAPGEQSAAVDEFVFVKTVCSEAGSVSCVNVEDIDLENSIYAQISLETVNHSLDRVYATYSGAHLGDRSVPVMGYGDAGKDCDLVPLSELNTHPNHPCNWNKIYYGESVNIPLFTKGAGDTDTTDIGEQGLNAFNIRVRTPCVFNSSYVAGVGETESDCSRQALSIEPLDGVGGGEGRVVVNWQILADCVDGAETGVCSVTNNVPTGSAFQQGYFTSATNSYKTVGKDNMVFDVYGSSASVTGLDFLGNFLIKSGTWGGFDAIDNTTLKLSYIEEAQTGGGNVPYMEYQLMYGDGVLISANPVFNVDAYAEGFKYSIGGVQDVGSNLFDFAVQN